MSANRVTPRLSAPLRISLLYALVGSAWIWLSDEQLFALVGRLPDVRLVSVGKGLFFVLASAALIYVLVRREVRRRQHSAAQLEAVLAAAPLGIVAMDDDGVITHWNRAAERTLGRTAGAAVGRRARELGFEHGALSGATGPMDVDVRRPDGGSVPMRLFTARLQDPGPALVLLLQDLSLQREAESAQRRIQKLGAVARLAGGVAQEFNNVLTTVLGHAALLDDSLPADDPRRHDVLEVRRAAERAAALTRQLLIISGHHVAQPALLDLSGLVHEMRGAIDRILGDAIRPELHLAADVWPVLGDPARLQQLVVNLLVNATEAMPDGGTLTIETRNVSATGHDPELPPGDYVLLRVADTGAGMDAATLERLFEPFFTTKRQGSGLGLATVYGTVQQFGGRIRVESAPGRGTMVHTFWSRAAAAESAPDGPSRTGGAGTILVVEDDPAVRALAARILRRAGHQVLTAASAEDALELVAAGTPFDLLVADVVMPGMNGPELAERLRQRRPGLPVLLTSGNAAGSFHSAAELHDGTAFIEKPYAPADLVARVADLLAPLR